MVMYEPKLTGSHAPAAWVSSKVGSPSGLAPHNKVEEVVVYINEADLVLLWIEDK